MYSLFIPIFTYKRRKQIKHWPKKQKYDLQFAKIAT